MQPSMPTNWSSPYLDAQGVLAEIDEGRLLPTELFRLPSSELYQIGRLDTNIERKIGTVQPSFGVVRSLLNYYSPFLPWSFTKKEDVTVYYVSGNYSFQTHQRKSLDYVSEFDVTIPGDRPIPYLSGQAEVQGYLVVISKETSISKSFSPEPKAGPGGLGDPSLGTPDELAFSVSSQVVQFYPTTFADWEPIPSTPSYSSPGPSYSWSRG